MESLTSNWYLKFDHWRVKAHFCYVERVLRQRTINHLSAELQQARLTNLERLHHYRQHETFPLNEVYPQYTSCFIDQHGSHCAVAYLITQAGLPEVAQKVARTENYMRVPQMKTPELEDWIAQSGLTKEEVAFIQPAYCGGDYAPVIGIGVGTAFWVLVPAVLSAIFSITSLVIAENNDVVKEKPTPRWLYSSIIWGGIALVFTMLLGLLMHTDDTKIISSIASCLLGGDPQNSQSRQWFSLNVAVILVLGGLGVLGMVSGWYRLRVYKGREGEITPAVE